MRARRVGLSSGVALRVVEAGPAGAPAVVLLHGWGCSAYSFRPLVGPLAEAEYRVVAPELPGHGLSDPLEDGEYTRERLIALLLELVAALELGPAVVVGHSLGGGLALALALEAPSRVRALVLLAPVGFTPMAVLRLSRWLLPAPVVRAAGRALTRSAVAAVLWLAYGMHGGFTAEDVEQYWLPTRRIETLLAARGLLREYAWGPYEAAELGRIGVPVLALFGARDPIVPAALAVRRARRIAGAVVRTLPRCGHVLAAECPADVVDALLAFLGCGPAARPAAG